MFTGSATLRGTFLCPEEVAGFVSVFSGSLESIPEHHSPEFLRLLVAGAWDFRTSGTYEITHLPAGVYTVVGSITPKDGDSSTRLDMKTHKNSLQEGETVELGIEF